MSKRVVTFGEIMLRLAPEGYYRLVQADKLGATYGGGEANVAVSWQTMDLMLHLSQDFHSMSWDRQQSIP